MFIDLLGLEVHSASSEVHPVVPRPASPAHVSKKQRHRVVWEAWELKGQEYRSGTSLPLLGSI